MPADSSMREYVDLHISASALKGEVLAAVGDFGFRHVGVSLEAKESLSTLRDCRTALQTYHVDAVSRIDLKPRNRVELLHLLRRFRRSFEVIAVECLSNEIALTAARDRRVDIIFFNPSDMKVRLNTPTAHVCNCSLELNASHIVSAKPRHRVFTRLAEEVKTAFTHDIPIVISSGATDRFKVKPPLQMASLATMFGLGVEESLKTVSDNPMGIVTRNRQKLSYERFINGVEVLNRR